jgi:hypothetical protein
MVGRAFGLARMVSGSATVATSLRALRPSRKPISPSVARSASESRKHPFNWARKMRFSAARYSLRSGFIDRFSGSARMCARFLTVCWMRA